MAKAIKKAPAGAVDRARARALGQEEAPAEPAVLGTPAAAQRSTLPECLCILSSSDRGEVASRLGCGDGMNKIYRLVLSDDEQKMLAVVLKKEKFMDLQAFVSRMLRRSL